MLITKVFIWISLSITVNENNNMLTIKHVFNDAGFLLFLHEVTRFFIFCLTCVFLTFGSKGKNHPIPGEAEESGLMVPEQLSTTFFSFFLVLVRDK